MPLFIATMLLDWLKKDKKNLDKCIKNWKIKFKKKENKKKRVPLIKWGLSTVQQLHGTQTLFFFN